MESFIDNRFNILLTISITVLLFVVGCGVVVEPIVSLVVFSSLFVIAYIFFQPFNGLILSIATAPIIILELLYDSPYRQISDYLPFTVLFVLITFFAWLFRRATKLDQDHIIVKRKYFLPVLFVSYAMVSLLWTIDLAHGIFMTFRLIIGVCFFFLINEMVFDREKLEKIMGIMPFIGLILASLTLLSKFKSIETVEKIAGNFYLHILFWTQNGVRPSGFANSALAANTLVFYIFMTIVAYATATTRWMRIIFSGILLFCMSMMFIISSKAAVGGLLVGVFFVIFFHPALRNKIIAATLIAFIVITSVYVFNATIMKGGGRMTESEDVATMSLSSRLGFWKTGFSYFESRWIGAGAGGILRILDPAPNSHSTYFSILFDFGMAGAFLFVLFLAHAGICLKKAIQHCSDNQVLWMLFGIGGAYIALLVHAIVDNFHYDTYFWMVIGMVYTISSVAEQTHPGDGYMVFNRKGGAIA